jgi:hypothetical protein
MDDHHFGYFTKLDQKNRTLNPKLDQFFFLARSQPVYICEILPKSEIQNSKMK